MKYTHLIFDADETLYDFKKSERNALKLTLNDFEITYNEAYHLPLYKKINQVLWDNLEKGLTTQESIKVKRFIDYKEALNASFDPEDFAGHFMKHLGDGSYLLDDAEELIKTLAPHYVLLILTNGLTVVQKNRLGNSTIAHYFDHQFISEEIGVAKPDPRIFDHVFKELDARDSRIKHSQYLMIGDSLTSDIQGGINAGINTCWVNLHDKVNHTNLVPTCEVNSLNELKELLALNK